MSPQAGWLLQDQIVPRLISSIPRAVSCIGCEDPQELVQDATAMAAKMLHNVEAAGKKVTPGNIAYYTIQHMKSGRRSTGSTVADVLGSGTQLNGRSRTNSFEEVVSSDEETGGEIFLLHDVLSNDQEDPSTKAARKMDWETFCAGLTDRELETVLAVAEGKSMVDVANKFRVSTSTIQNVKKSLGDKLLALMGNDILVEVRRSPRWKDNLAAADERMACRHERRQECLEQRRSITRR
jgi:hypothetical protein